MPFDDAVELMECAFEPAEPQHVVGTGGQAALNAFCDVEIFREGAYRDVMVLRPVVRRFPVRYRYQRQQADAGLVRCPGCFMDPDDVVFLDQELAGRENRVHQIGVAPQAPALPGSLHHCIQGHPRQDRAQMAAEYLVA